MPKNHGWEHLAEVFHTSVRKPQDRKVGIELERIGIWEDGYSLHYTEGNGPNGDRRPGAEQLLRELSLKPGWTVSANGKGQPLGFSTPFGKVSLEPGSQLELSTKPTTDLFSQAESVRKFEREVDAVGRPWGLSWIGLGVNPLTPVDRMDVIPSTRYHIMTDYLGRRARLGTSMMRLTSSIQVNLDYTGEAEAIEMLRAALTVAPVSYALFGNSPLAGGAETTFLSQRSQIWRETDPDRTGLLPEAFEEGFDFASYARLAWHRPLMFAQNTQREYVPAEGKSLADIANGKLPHVEADGENRLNCIRELFFEARLKPGYVEVRSVDGQRVADRYLAVAFWVGILYSHAARQTALRLLGNLSPADRDALWASASREGLNARLGKLEMLPIATSLVEASREGLKARGHGEERLLDPVEKYLGERTNPAGVVQQLFRGPWKRDMRKVIQYAASTEESP